jgi:rRNA maturation endonuclease Nob1
MKDNGEQMSYVKNIDFRDGYVCCLNCGKPYNKFEVKSCPKCGEKESIKLTRLLKFRKLVSEPQRVK